MFFEEKKKVSLGGKSRKHDRQGEREVQRQQRERREKQRLEQRSAVLLQSHARRRAARDVCWRAAVSARGAELFARRGVSWWRTWWSRTLAIW